VIAAALCIIAIIGALVILPRLGHGGGSPQHPGTSQGAGVLGGGTPTGGGPTAGSSAQPGATSASPQQPLAIGKLTTAYEPLGTDLLDLKRWRVTIVIDNPAAVAQNWDNVSVGVNGGTDLALDSLTQGVRVYQPGQVVCAAPTTSAAATVPANGSITIEFHVRSSSQPGPARIDDPRCA
jgi:hypothetical protein